MRAGSSLVVWLVGCLWVTPAEHAQNQRDLAAGTGDADVDGDADSDTDTDVDTDTDTDSDTGIVVGCVDDAYEGVSDPIGEGEVEGVLCPDDDDAPGVLLDTYPVVVGAERVLVVQIDGRDGTSCAELSAQLSIRDVDGVPFPDASLDGGCGTVRSGWTAGPVEIWVVDAPTDTEQAYTLSVAFDVCRDGDDDGFLSGGCGGPDCNGLDGTWYPGAPDPQDGSDQDCDGGDDLAPLGCEIATGAPADGTLPCGDPAADPVWDVYTVPVAAGSTVSVVADNAGGDADLLALVVDPDGTSHFGLADGQLDDEAVCSATPWTGGGCPAACVATNTGGDAQLWIAQQPGAGCTPTAPYQLLVYVDNLPVDPVPLTGDDVPLAVSFD